MLDSRVPNVGSNVTKRAAAIYLTFCTTAGMNQGSEAYRKGSKYGVVRSFKQDKNH